MRLYLKQWLYVISDYCTITDREKDLQRPAHGCVAAAYLGSASANRLSDSERRQASETHRFLGDCRGVDVFFLPMIVQTKINTDGCMNSVGDQSSRY